MHRRLVVLVAILGVLSAVSLVLAVRASAPVRSEPAAVVVRWAPPPKTRFPRLLLFFANDPCGIFGRVDAVEAPLNVAELLAGLSLPSSTSRLVGDLVRAAQAEIRALRNTPDTTGRTWDSITSSDHSPGQVYQFRQQVIPGSNVTFDDRQASIRNDLFDRIEGELQQSGQEPLFSSSRCPPLCPPFLLPLLHQSVDWCNWHLLPAR